MYKSTTTSLCNERLICLPGYVDIINTFLPQQCIEYIHDISTYCVDNSYMPLSWSYPIHVAN